MSSCGIRRKNKRKILNKKKRKEREGPLITTITYKMENFFYIYIYIKEDSWLCILIIIII